MKPEPGPRETDIMLRDQTSSTNWDVEMETTEPRDASKRAIVAFSSPTP